MTTKKLQKTPKKYECTECDFITSNKNDFNRHLSTDKHKNTTKYNKIQPKNPTYECECGKTYPYRSSLYNHQKKCQKRFDEKTPKNSKLELIIDEKVKEQVKDQVKDNMIEFYKQELDKKDKQLAELKKVNITNNNQKFNLSVFLNDTCKDALSIQDFVKSLTLTLDNLEYSKINGPEAGMINILKEGLMELDVEKRPIHCTDSKRETLYIKDTDNGWEKNSKTNNMFKTAVNNLQDRQSVLMKDWQQANPGWIEDNDKVDEFHKLLDTTYCDVNDKKVLKDIAKVIEIEKTN